MAASAVVASKTLADYLCTDFHNIVNVRGVPFAHKAKRDDDNKATKTSLACALEYARETQSCLLPASQVATNVWGI